MSQPSWPLLPSSEKRSTRGRSSADSGPSPRANSADAIPIIAFSHLGWDWVWQRPQQYLSRFAKNHSVLFVETYRSDVAATRIETRVADGQPNVTVLQMHLPSARWDDGKFIDAERRRALK